MKKIAKSDRRQGEWKWTAGTTASMFFGTATALLVTGCGGSLNDSAPSVVSMPAISGSVYGGRQPISGAAVHLYAAGTSGYAGTNNDLLSPSVTTASDGTFTITGDYNCTTGQQMYIVTIGGNTGSGSANPQAGIMAALGECSTLASLPYIQMNEVTTVGSAFALAPFMAGYTALGTSSTNTAGLARAFASVKKLVDITAGTSSGPALPAGATAPSAEINSLANVLAACVNSTGGAAPGGVSDGSTCGNLFSYITTSGGGTPTDTIGAAVAIAQNPGLNVASIYGLIGGTPPYSSGLTSTPTDWAMAVNYTGFSSPQSTTIDASGNVWVADSGAGKVYVLAQTGAPLGVSPFSGNGLNAPATVAIDASGNGWVANKGGTTVSAFTSIGSALSNSPFTVGTAPTALAFDATGNLWVANSTSSSITELSSTGTSLQTVTTGISTPTAIAIDPK